MRYFFPNDDENNPAFVPMKIFLKQLFKVQIYYTNNKQTNQFPINTDS